MRWNNLLSNLCFALNCFLLFLALFGAKMELPSFLQVAGRMHPLVLHFPIVLMSLAVVWALFVTDQQHPVLSKTTDALLLASSLSAVLAALMGLFLSKEGGYSEETLAWHQWSGIAVSVLAWIAYTFRAFFRSKQPNRWLAGLSLGALIIAGHQGATLTHGENYLFAPIAPKENAVPVLLENALVFEHLVRPILKEKCMNCHNTSKSKGDLSFETEAQILKGGKNGSLWDLSAKHLGLLLQRVHLPIETEEHMPPKGKAQLTVEEIEILHHWVKNGSSFTQKISELPENDTLRLLANQRLQKPEEAPYPFEASDEATIKSLNNDYRVVYPLALNSPALSVDFFGAGAFNPAGVKELEAVKNQVVSLNLAKMPLTDEALSAVTIFPNLRKLNLGFTKITGAQLSELKTLQSLQSLSLSGTSVKLSDLGVLNALPQLREVFLWNTGLTPGDFETLRQQLPRVRIESGYSGEGVIAKLNAPIIEGEEQVFSTNTTIRLKNFIKGAEIRYTLDGSLPDSLNSPVFPEDSFLLDKSCQFSARAFLPGWISSEMATKSFYKTGFLPDSVVLLYPPNVQYKGEGPKTLANKKIGDTDFRTNKWLGYKETNLEALLLFKEPVMVSMVSFSSLVDIGSYIMPAAEIQVWGGNDPKNLSLLKKINPKQPEKLGMPGYRLGFNCRFDARKVSVLKIVAKPVKKLPAWHPGKGDLGWVFLDEIFLE